MRYKYLLNDIKWNFYQKLNDIKRNILSEIISILEWTIRMLKK